MKLHQLRSVAAVFANDLNITQAAAKLNATQPGISAHIRALEQEVGAPIFLRGRKRLTDLTPLGTKLMPAIVDVVERAEALKLEARRLTSPRERPIVIASGPTASHILPRTFSIFRERYPKIRVILRNGCHDGILEDLKDNRADIGLLTSPAGAPPQIEFLSCFTLGWDLLVREGSDLALLPEVTLEEINNHPIVTYDDQFASSNAIAQAFDQAGLSMNIAISVGDVDAMKRFVRARLGSAILRSGNFDPSIDHGIVAHSLDRLFEPSVVYAGVQGSGNLSAPMRYMLKLLQEISVERTEHDSERR